jgi:hypothetical protein
MADSAVSRDEATNRDVDPSGRLGHGPAVAVRRPRQQGQEGVTAVEANKRAVRRFYEKVLNGRNLDAIDELVARDGAGSHLRELERRAGQAVRQEALPGLSRPGRPGPRRDRRGRAGGRPSDLQRHPPGRVCRHPRHRGAHTTVNGVDFFRTQGLPAGRAFGRAGHVELPGAGGGHTGTRHTGTRTSA